jgi:hypothetical protein
MMVSYHERFILGAFPTRIVSYQERFQSRGFPTRKKISNYFRQFVVNIDVKTLNILCLQLFIFLQFSTLTFIEIYRFIVRNFSKKTINLVFIVLSIFFEKDTL